MCLGSPHLPAEAQRGSHAYLRAADRLVPGVVACAAGGSLALGAYREAASDIDLVALISDDWRGRRDLIPRLRFLHASQFPRIAGRVLRGLGPSAMCNTAFIFASDVGRPVSQISPVASHVGEQFVAGCAFDVNPVMWTQLADGGVSLRGPEVAEWDVNPEPESLIPWTQQNLREYWLPLAGKLDHGTHSRLLSKWPISAGAVAWRVLGPARMNATITTGEILSKEAAGLRARELFPQHRAIVDVALTELRGAKPPQLLPRSHWRAATSAAMRDIIYAVSS